MSSPESPLATPPPGEQYNFVDPPTRETEVYAGMSVMLVIVSLSMLLRLYTKLFLKQEWAIEDLFVWIGYASIVTHDALVLTSKFVGVHTWDVKITYLTKELQEQRLSAVLLFPVAALFVKLALFSLYLRLFRSSLLARRLIYIGAATCSVFYLAAVLTVSISCVPDPRGPNDAATWFAKLYSSCLQTDFRTALAQGVFGTISDIYLFSIPIQTVLRLQLPLRRKIGVSAVFMTGILAISCSITTLALRKQEQTATDPAWLSAVIYLFNSAEVCAGIICVNIPLSPGVFSQPVEKPDWFRFPRNVQYFSRRWTGRGNSSEKSLVGSTEGITLHRDILVEHGERKSSESIAVPSMPTVSHISNLGGQMEQYHVDISGGVD